MKILVSKKSYDKKPDNNAAIIKMANQYEEVDITPKELFDKCITGHHYHAPCGASASASGSGCLTFKKSLLKETSILSLDFDYKKKNRGGKPFTDEEMPVWTRELLELEFKGVNITPTFWYRSFSHKEGEHGLHVIYVLNSPVTNVSEYEQLATGALYAFVKALEAKGIKVPVGGASKVLDPKSVEMFQGMWGTCNGGEFYDRTYPVDLFSVKSKEQLDEMSTYLFGKTTQSSYVPTAEDMARAKEAFEQCKSTGKINPNGTKYTKYEDKFSWDEVWKPISYLKWLYFAPSGGSEENEDPYSLDQLRDDNPVLQICASVYLGHTETSPELATWDSLKRLVSRIGMWNEGKAPEIKWSAIDVLGGTGAIPIRVAEPARKNPDLIVNLNENEHLSDKIRQITSFFTDGINMIVAAPGTGKTVFAQNLPGKTLVIELFTSIIDSEEKFPSETCDKFKAGNTLRWGKRTKNVGVCTPNQFVGVFESDKWEPNPDIINYYDTVVLDESHLLASEDFRYDVMGATVRWLKALAESGKRVIIMTGTPQGEDTLFENLNVIQVNKPQKYSKKIDFVHTRSLPQTAHALIADEVGSGRRVLVPMDSENEFNTLALNLIENGVVKKEECFYFCRNNREETPEIHLLNTKTLKDVKVLGCSSYMSVGIDVEDYDTPFTVLFPGGQHGSYDAVRVEQFANRLRKQDLRVYYLVTDSADLNAIPGYAADIEYAYRKAGEMWLRMFGKLNPMFVSLPKYLLRGDEESEIGWDEDAFRCFIHNVQWGRFFSTPGVVLRNLKDMGWDCRERSANHQDYSLAHTAKEERALTRATSLEEWELFLRDMGETVAQNPKCRFDLTGGDSYTYKVTKMLEAERDLFSVDVPEEVAVSFSYINWVREHLAQYLWKMREILQVQYLKWAKEKMTAEKFSERDIKRFMKALYVHRASKDIDSGRVYHPLLTATKERMKKFVDEFPAHDPETESVAVYKRKFEDGMSSVINETFLSQLSDDDRRLVMTDDRAPMSAVKESLESGVSTLMWLYVKQSDSRIQKNLKRYKTVAYEWNPVELE